MPLHPTKTILEKYTREFEFLNLLKGNDHVPKRPEMRRSGGVNWFIMARFPGVSIKSLLTENQNMSVPEFLDLSIRIVEGVKSIHQAGIIHQQLNYEHVLVDAQRKNICFIDFSLATTVNRTQATCASAKAFSHNYQWIAPEQTGRMNRDVDYRTDYYTIGLLFYKILSGSMPFQDHEESKLLYDHIAREPPLLHEVNERVPVSISLIIKKLLNKCPDDRYQSTHGIIYDLNWVKENINNNNIITTGKMDSRPVFQMSQKVYGRSIEIQRMRDLFDEVANHKVSSHMLIVSGPSGCGKTLLINEIQRTVLRHGGYFISGKADQIQRSTPYASVIQAFQQLVNNILIESPDRIKEWRRRLLLGLRGRGRVIIDSFPEVSLIIGEQPELPSLGPVESQMRFRSVFIDFVMVFANSDHPLALFLDDIHWDESSTLSLLETIITHPLIQNLFLIATARSNELKENQYLLDMKSRLEAKEQLIDIKLNDLSKESVIELISDSLGCTHDKVIPLVEIIMIRTSGNPLFINVYMKSLLMEKLIVRDAATGTWNWNIQNILSVKMSTDVVTLLTHRYSKLSEQLQKTLSIASCIGNKFSIGELSYIARIKMRELLLIIFPAIEDQLSLVDGDRTISSIERTDDKSMAAIECRFVHDRVQQTAYEALPENDRSAMHMDIAKLYLGQNMENNGDNIFEIVHHLMMSKNLLYTMTDRSKVPELCLQAAQRAKTSSAFTHGYDYASLGVSLLNDVNDWNTRYRTTFDLHMIKTECAFMSNRAEEADRLFSTILKMCRTPEDIATVYFAWSNRYDWQQRHMTV